MGFILEDRLPDGRPNAWYAGRNEKYPDMIDLTAKKEYASVFQDGEDAVKKAGSLNRGGWNFVILEI